MLTIEKLQEFGANTEEGMSRCLNNQDFYLRLVNMVFAEQGFEKLKESLANKDVTASFEAAHALKGVLGNLSLTPVFQPMSEITEILRAGSLEGTEPLAEQIFAKMDELKKLAA